MPQIGVGHNSVKRKTNRGASNEIFILPCDQANRVVFETKKMQFNDFQKIVNKYFFMKKE